MTNGPCEPQIPVLFYPQYCSLHCLSKNDIPLVQYALPEVLDLSKWSKNASSSTKASLAKDWQAAFSSHGLVKEGLKTVIENFAFDKNFGKVWLTNHGLDSLYNSVQSEWRKFCKLDQEEKENFSAPRYFRVTEYWIMRWTISAEWCNLLTFSQFAVETLMDDKFLLMLMLMLMFVLSATEVLDTTILGQRQ